MDQPPIDLEAFNSAFAQLIPQNAALGLVVVEASWEPPVAVVRLPWDERWVGNPETGVLHGGVITTLLDTASGASVFFKLRAPTQVATLDLRIDYLQPATPRQAVLARAECIKATHNVAFVRAIAYHQDPGDPIATSTGTFMLGRAFEPGGTP